METKQLIETGVIVNTHGVHGEVKVNPWADSPEILLRIKTFYIDHVCYSVEKSRVQNNCLLLKLKNVNSVETADALRNKVICFDKNEYPAKNGYYIVDLIGIAVYTNDTCIGKITEVMQLPGNDVWVVNGEREFLIPARKEFVHNIDLQSRRADVLLLEGMASDEN